MYYPSLSLSSPNGSTISIRATSESIDVSHDFSESFAVRSPLSVLDNAEDKTPVLAANPYQQTQSLIHLADQPVASPSQPPQTTHEPLTLRIPERALSPELPPAEPTLPLPSPGTPSPSFLVPSPGSSSFFSFITGCQRRRKKMLTISGAPLELPQPCASSSLSPMRVQDDLVSRQAEQRCRVENAIKWCKSFGPVQKIETKEDQSLHIYWKDWEVADMVSAA